MSMKPIMCKNCHEEIVQLPSGTWIDKNGVVWCPSSEMPHTNVLHEPIISPEWARSIQNLSRRSPSFWTPQELAKLFQLTEAQIKEILE